MQKRIDLILNGKGGVGKSFFAINFVQYLKDNQVEHVAIDTDNENSTLKRFHPEALFVDLSDTHQMDGVFSMFEKTNLVVVDCRAASTDLFLDYFEEIGAFEILSGIAAPMTVILPVNHDSDSVEQVKAVVEDLKGRCNYLIVKNQAFSELFTIYENTPIRRLLVEEMAGKEITMPKLYDWLVAALNRTNSTITSAQRSSAFSMMDRQRLKNWQRIFYGQLEGVRGILIPQGEQTSGDTNKMLQTVQATPRKTPVP